jgi:hypothetical protein
MHKTTVLALSLVALVFCYSVDSAKAGEVPAAQPLIIGSSELTPRIRIVEREHDLPKVVDLELRCSVKGGGGLFVVDPFFTCQWPMYSSVALYDDEGEPLGYAEMPPLKNWDGETQGRQLGSGQICGRRFVLSFNGGNPNPPMNKGPVKRARMQLILRDGIAANPDGMGSIGRAYAKRPSEKVVARSELVDLGEIPTGLNFYLIDPDHCEPSENIKSGLDVRLDGPSKYKTDPKPAYVDVILHNNSSTMSPLFDPGQKHYGHDRSPLEREVFSRPDNERVYFSKDGLGPSVSHSMRTWEAIVKLPPHTFYGCSQPWLDKRKSGQFRLNVIVHDWIVCPLKDGKYAAESKGSSPALTSASFEFTVE